MPPGSVSPHLSEALKRQTLGRLRAHLCYPKTFWLFSVARKQTPGWEPGRPLPKSVSVVDMRSTPGQQHLPPSNRDGPKDSHVIKADSCSDFRDRYTDLGKEEAFSLELGSWDNSNL